ncbi:MAG: exodeoxyribonuclease VII small subunit [Anaerolineales bacterium]|nr:exodeoxyribonuclease VII small subunit [Anaerolineales bacterium]
MTKPPAAEWRTDQLPLDQLTFEQAFAQLDEIVAALETGEHTLNEAITLFERGQSLSQHCASLLDQAELKVQQILGDQLKEFNLNE